MKRRYWLVLLYCFLVKGGNAQSSVQEFMSLGFRDASLLASAYLSPLTKTYGLSANANWVQSAEPLKPFRVSLMASFNGLEVKDAMTYFNPSTLGLTQVRFQSPNSRIPTVFGTAFPEGLLSVYGKSPVNGQEELWVESAPPPGIAFSFFATPMIQASIGVGGGTELMFRFFPKNKFVLFDNMEGAVDLWGGGFKHSISQYFFNLRDAKRPFDWSIFTTVSRLNSSIGLYFNPDFSNLDVVYKGPPSPVKNQSVGITSTNWQVGTNLSKELGVFTFYGAINYQFSSTNVSLEGPFPYIEGYETAQGPNFGKVVINVKDNPIAFSNTYTGLGYQIGMRFRFLYVLSFYGEYAYAQSLNTVNAGLGILID